LLLDIKAEIVARVDNLPPEMQAQVLRFVNSLAAPTPKGETGSTLRSFAGCLDSLSAGEMARAIEEECERVDADQW
jgi:hypothetical protein